MVSSLQGQLEELTSSSAAASSSGLLKPTATWMADQTLNVLSHPLLSSEGMAFITLRFPYLAVKRLHTSNTTSLQLQPSLP